MVVDKSKGIPTCSLSYDTDRGRIIMSLEQEVSQSVLVPFVTIFEVPFRNNLRGHGSVSSDHNFGISWAESFAL